jgi:alkanesulfonate monooxygenase SsuD/methylene tetrahydromethanopterin reductase-like flavin-dependent oxidoreductase (luciferase family)
MKLGYFTMPLHPPTRDYTQTLKEDREAIVLADRLGYSEAFVGEHVTDQAETITSCLMFIASLMSETKQIKLGSGTVNLLNSHPAAVAAQVAMIDHLLEGRFLLGISPGGLRSDAEVFGNLDADRTAMFREAIDLVLKIWTSEPPYDLTGQFWTLSTARTMMTEIGQGYIARPLQQPHPPVVVTAVSPYSHRVIEAAARGWEVISANFLLPKWVATHWTMYVGGCARGGRQPNPANWRVAKSIFVADDLKQAEAYALGPQSPYRYYYKSLLTKLLKGGRGNQFKENAMIPDSAVTLDGVLDDLVIWGTPDKVADEIAAFRQIIGDFGTLLYAGKDWADPALARRSMVLLKEQVLPRL